MRTDVFTYTGDPALEAHWVRFAPHALVDLGNPFVARAERCEVAGQRQIHVLRWQPLVLDARGNTGGSSSHGVALANALWGEPFLADAVRRAMRDRPPIVIDWRASRAVQTHVEGLAALHPSLAAAARGIAEARAAHRPLFSQPDDPLPPPADPAIAPATRARVILLTDGRCASACLDFADLLLRANPGVVHAGTPTAAGTEYMEVRRTALPAASS